METYNFQRAIKDFRSARQKATLREIIARLKGESLDLLSFEDVRHKLKAQIGSKKVLKEIPIKGIIGSVNRYQDFMRDFLPRRNINEERWINIDTANQGMLGLPPIEVYQIDEAYFVSDGNHRVSVAKQLGATEIQAYVTEVRSRVPLTDDIRLEDLILKSELVEFLENTNLDKLRPDSNPFRYFAHNDEAIRDQYTMDLFDGFSRLVVILRGAKNPDPRCRCEERGDACPYLS